MHLVHFSMAKKSEHSFKTIFIETALSLSCSSSFCASPHFSEKGISAAATTVPTVTPANCPLVPQHFVHYFNFSSLVFPPTNDYVDKLEFTIVEGQQHKLMQ